MNNKPQTTEQADIARIRAMCRKGFEEATPRILAIANGEIEGTSRNVQAHAARVLRKYGVPVTPNLKNPNPPNPEPQTPITEPAPRQTNGFYPSRSCPKSKEQDTCP